MKKTIVVADRDESLQHAFMTVFSKAHFEIIHASNGKEVEKISEKMSPDVYIVNVNLPKMNGIEVYKKLQKQKLLDRASFFFLKDESDTTELLGYQADGVIEKPINFFRVYETVTREDEAVELVDLVEDRPDTARQPTEEKTDEDGVRLADFVGLKVRDAEPEEEEVTMAPLGRSIESEADDEDPSSFGLTDEEMKSSIRQLGARLAAELEASSVREPVTAAPEEPKPRREETITEAAETKEAEFVSPPLVKVFEEVAPPEEEPTVKQEPETTVEAQAEGIVSVEEEIAQEEVRARKETRLAGAFGERLKDVMDNLTTGREVSLADAMGGVDEMGEGQSELEAQFKTVLNQAMEEAALKLSARLAPVLTRYVEDYVKRMLLEIAEKVIREEIEKLLKESTE